MSNREQNVLVPEPVVGHGSTVAAWTLVLVVTVGLIVATVAFDTLHYTGMIIGGVIMVLGLLAGWVLKAMGYGKNGAKTNARASH